MGERISPKTVLRKIATQPLGDVGGNRAAVTQRQDADEVVLG
jgi:hypothetical protein